jgi:hypothetical protein
VSKLGIAAEMVLDRALALSGHEQHASQSGTLQLFEDVLHDRLVDDRQHLLWR